MKNGLPKVDSNRTNFEGSQNKKGTKRRYDRNALMGGERKPGGKPSSNGKFENNNYEHLNVNDLK